MKKSILTLAIAVSFLIGCSPTGQESEPSQFQEIIAMETKHTETSPPTENTKTMYPQLSAYITSILPEIKTIPQERKEALLEIARFVQTQKESNKPANLTFICTHNSRRSHMSQIWASTAAAHYGLENGINTYSGGTEATAFNPRAVAAMERAGFKIDKPGGENPLYRVSYSETGKPMLCFSKKYDDPENPSENFVAVLTCSEADQNCPFIPGASLRVPVPYLDPKEADGTERESAAYDERCKQIATEMFFIMSQVKG